MMFSKDVVRQNIMLYMKTEEEIIKEIQIFFNDIFEVKEKTKSYAYADYKIEIVKITFSSI